MKEINRETNIGMLPTDDAVSIEKVKKGGGPPSWLIAVNCQDQTGLACDICRTILEYGLFITKGDFSTDGRWCYVVLWVVPHSSSGTVRWSSLKDRLISICPPSSLPFYYNDLPTSHKSSPLYLLKFCCLDRRGLLHDITQILTELELTIHKVKVTTTPDDRVLDLFFITDNLKLLHKKERQKETCEQLCAVLGDSCVSCELELADTQHNSHHGISLSLSVSDELFRSEYLEKEHHMQALSPDMTRLKKANMNIDNSLSPNHTLLQIHCTDHKGLLYDILRTLKDRDIPIAFGRYCPAARGERDVDLFVNQKDGKKIIDTEEQFRLFSSLKGEMLHPLRVIVANRGPDAELLVANPVELCGRGRPRVFLDVTLALKTLGICIFSAEVGRFSSLDREWEVYRFLLDENCEYHLLSVDVRSKIVDKVRRVLMGW